MGLTLFKNENLTCYQSVFVLLIFFQFGIVLVIIIYVTSKRTLDSLEPTCENETTGFGPSLSYALCLPRPLPPTTRYEPLPSPPFNAVSTGKTADHNFSHLERQNICASLIYRSAELPRKVTADRWKRGAKICIFVPSAKTRSPKRELKIEKK